MSRPAKLLAITMLATLAMVSFADSNENPLNLYFARCEPLESLYSPLMVTLYSPTAFDADGTCFPMKTADGTFDGSVKYKCEDRFVMEYLYAESADCSTAPSDGRTGPMSPLGYQSMFEEGACMQIFDDAAFMLQSPIDSSKLPSCIASANQNGYVNYDAFSCNEGAAKWPTSYLHDFNNTGDKVCAAFQMVMDKFTGSFSMECVEDGTKVKSQLYVSPGCGGDVISASTAEVEAWYAIAKGDCIDNKNFDPDAKTFGRSHKPWSKDHLPSCIAALIPEAPELSSARSELIFGIWPAIASIVTIAFNKFPDGA
eukprot:gnl/TRDRNA2_/TRDRNA2_64108_c0_seq1.p1 gnl/TRDRNA2_/TRDRNA2_64108_c0~~gnl/TRDRNA2_/TRDRNA2_64108_c0_seq1.p1  ORF type:complete len:325 (-),score=42.69 gnl/TRDRNA2_/TRDRNA2_64108_c0_seq1:72-1010(-)